MNKTDDIKLLPLPYEGQMFNEQQMHDYARANVAHATASLQAEVERLSSYYKNGIECFANPCERHSGERTPPFAEFFEKYGGLCLICVVDNNRDLQAENERLAEALREAADMLLETAKRIRALLRDQEAGND